MQSCYCAVLERVRQKAKRLGKNREAKPLGGVVIAPSVAAARTLMQSLPAMAVAREEGVRG